MSVDAGFRSLSWVAAAAVVSVPLFSPGSPISLVKVSLAQPALTIVGSIDGLVAGRDGGLALTIHNPARDPTVVRGLSARVTSASAGCSATALVIDSWAGHVVVPAHGAAQVTLPIRLTAVAGECAGATWKLAYSSF